MKTLKAISIGFLALVAVLMIVSVFIPSQVHIERSMIIQAPKELIFQQVNALKNWEEWSPWLSDTSRYQLDYQGSEAGEGASYSWMGRINGSNEGELIISNSRPFERIEMNLTFNKGRTAQMFFKFEELPDGVRTTWGIQTDVGRSPYAKYRGLMLDHTIGRHLEEGLTNLKKIAEDN